MGARNAVFACFVASLAFLAVLFSVVRADPGELPQLALRAGPEIAFAPADVDVVVIARPDNRNRLLAVAIGATDSAYASSSQQSLRGEDERGQVAHKVYKSVPPGHYQIVAALYDREGNLLARVDREVRRLNPHGGR